MRVQSRLWLLATPQVDINVFKVRLTGMISFVIKNRQGLSGRKGGATSNWLLFSKTSLFLLHFLLSTNKFEMGRGSSSIIPDLKS